MGWEAQKFQLGVNELRRAPKVIKIIALHILILIPGKEKEKNEKQSGQKVRPTGADDR